MAEPTLNETANYTAWKDYGDVYNGSLWQSHWVKVSEHTNTRLLLDVNKKKKKKKKRQQRPLRKKTRDRSVPMNVSIELEADITKAYPPRPESWT